MERDKEADLLAIACALGVVPIAMGVLGSWMWPLFRSAGDSVHQVYTIPEILTGLVGGGAIGFALGAIFLYVRSKTETPSSVGH